MRDREHNMHGYARWRAIPEIQERDTVMTPLLLGVIALRVVAARDIRVATCYRVVIRVHAMSLARYVISRGYMVMSYAIHYEDE